MICTDIEGLECVEYKRSRFYLLSYGYFFKPQHDIVIVLDCTKVNHRTITNIDYNQYDVVLIMKKKNTYRRK
jgi:hypothetical protein